MHPRTLAAVVALLATPALAAPEISLPEGVTATRVAAPPLLKHPVWAAPGGPGQLFVCDMAGLNLNKAELEAQRPNRVLRLTDRDGDGTYDEQTIFADGMTFPNGGVWLGDSLYVCSAPGLWRLTDADGDGIAEQRKAIVTGFDYTGNAADLHGPFLHPGGRLYWCHGRKGYEATQSDGTVAARGLSSGIWSCTPEGLDVRWHSLVAGDNPVEVDFTPEGDVIGTMNLYFSRPRGDVIMHWLRGGVYPREDQMKVIDGLPRTVEPMPVAHNFGHVAVSGCAFHRSGALDPAWRGHLFVTHFNTGRITRMELTRDGATWRVAEREFLQMQSPDAHLTDVLEDRDGSLLVVDTGGWFRNGCPSSLIAKPEVAGAIYRIRRQGEPARTESWDAATQAVWALARKGGADSVRALIEKLGASDASLARAAANALADLRDASAAPALIAALEHRDAGVRLAATTALGALPSLDTPATDALLRQLAGDLEPVLEHQTMEALIRAMASRSDTLLSRLGSSLPAPAQRRILRVLEQMPGSPLTAERVVPLLGSMDPALAASAAEIIARHGDWAPPAAAHFSQQPQLPPADLALLETALRGQAGAAAVRPLLTRLLTSPEAEARRTAWRILAGSAASAPDPAWAAPLLTALRESAPGDQSLVIAALSRVRTAELNAALAEFAADEKRPLALRLKALAAAPSSGATLPVESFHFLEETLTQSQSSAARLEAARLLSAAKLSRESLLTLALTIPKLGPLELREIIGVIRRTRDQDVGLAWAHALKTAPALASISESELRTIFSSLPPEVFGALLPALRATATENEARRRQLDGLPALVESRGRVNEGRALFTIGKGACVSCHRVSGIGNVVGPELTTIGRIRSPRDILESIYFPDASTAQGYEAHTVETASGASLLGVIRRNLPDAIVLVDPTGQEQTIPRAQITGLQALHQSLMPAGLDRTLTEQELLDLVAFLSSCK